MTMAHTITDDKTNDIIVQGFSDIVSHNKNNTSNKNPKQGLQWTCAPDGWTPLLLEGCREGRDGSWSADKHATELTIVPPAKKDYWRKTYYDPIMIKDDGPFLHTVNHVLETAGFYTIAVQFDLQAARQFDQAGIMIRVNAEHWIKTGIEVVDGHARLSCVVTNGYSDWSTQAWTGQQQDNTVGVLVQKVPLRVHWRAGSVVVESQLMPEIWDFIRIAHLETGAATTFQAGVFACAPADQQGTRAVFRDFSIRRGSHMEHNADGV